MTLTWKTKVVLITSAYLIVLTSVVYYLIMVGWVKFYVISFLVIPYGYSYTTMISITLLILYSLLTLATLPDVVKYKSVDAQVGSFINRIAAYLKSGVTLYEAIRLAKDGLVGYFKDVVDRLDTMISLGVSFDDAVNMVLKEVNHEYGYVLRILSVAMRSGGRSVDVVEKASNILSYFHTYRDYRKRMFKQYLVLLIMIVIVYDFTVAFLVLMLNSLTKSELPFIIKPDVELIYTLLYYTSIAISSVSGISYGKATEGSILRAFPYVLAITTLNSTLIHILPAVVVNLL
ncbi:MAG: type II secretion system F family protein [Sulfolobales archaeon]